MFARLSYIKKTYSQISKQYYNNDSVLFKGVSIIAKQEGHRHPLPLHTLRESWLTFEKFIHQQFLAPATTSQVKCLLHLGQTELLTNCNSINFPIPISSNMHLTIIEKTYQRKLLSLNLRAIFRIKG